MLQIDSVSHTYDDLVSLRNVTLSVQPGEIVCLLGPSGCGKTTLLRIIAGLESGYQGRITVDGEDIRGIPVHLREFGLMFQDFALFPHMLVADNVAYGLKRRGIDRKSISSQVEALMSRVGLEGMAKRDVASLSGGQQQRVALARSLAPNPRLLMLDEPLGSLDAQLRDQLALELRAIIKDRGLSAIYVTHDHQEAYAVGDRIAVMNIGSVQQVDVPQNLYRRPNCAFVARFLGMRNIFQTDHSSFTKQLYFEAIPNVEGVKTLLIHPAGLHLEKTETSRSLRFAGTLQSMVFRGDHFDVSVSLGEETTFFFSTPQAPSQIGETVSILVALDAVSVLHN